MQRNAHNDAPQSVGLLWRSYQLVAETSTDNTKRSQQTDIHATTGFEPAIQTSVRPQVYALDRAATGTGIYDLYYILNVFLCDKIKKNEIS